MKYLAKLQLSFHSVDGSAVSDANLLEAYSISFTYENGNLCVGTAEGENAAANSVVLRDAKHDLYKLVDHVMLATQKKPPLPGKLTLQSLYSFIYPQVQAIDE
jgi:hypothetical protein